MRGVMRESIPALGLVEGQVVTVIGIDHKIGRRLVKWNKLVGGIDEPVTVSMDRDRVAVRGEDGYVEEEK